MADTIAPMEPASDVTPAPSTMPVGRSGRLEAMALAAAGDHAVLVREAGADQRGRALITTDKLPSGERLVIMPLDEEVDVRVDGDALAVWLGAGSIQQVPQRQMAVDARHVPMWATLAGGALLLLVVAFAVIGSAVTFAWLMSLVS